MLGQYGKLAIAVLVYFTLALPVAIYVCMRQGFGRHAGWFYLLSLTIVRIVGSILRIVYDFQPSTGLFIAALVFTTIGLLPLLLCFLGMVKRVNDGSRGRKHPPRFFQLIHLVVLVSLILTIIAASDTGSTDAGTLSTALALRKAASILFLVIVVGTAALMLTYASQSSLLHPGDRVIVLCSLAAAPFLIVRVIYTVLVAFENNATFNTFAPDIYAEAFMQSLMEFIVFALFAAAGFLAPTISKGDTSYTGGGSELGKAGQYQGGSRFGRQQQGVTQPEHVQQEQGYRA